MIQYLYLGRIGYDEALALQQEIVELRYQGRVDNVLLLLEHPPVLTLGRNAGRANVLATDEMLARKGVTIHETKRGGDVTYHGPGQLVGYPIFDLRSLTNSSGGRLGPVDHVRKIEEALIRLCAGYGVLTGRVAGRTGVWTNPTVAGEQVTGRQAAGEKKVGAIGVHVSRGITSHGFALNVTTDLRDFQWIVPCGIADREVTSLELEVADPASLPTLEGVADAAARQFGLVYGEQVLAVDSLDALRGNLRPGTRQVGVPLAVPAEVERLRRLTEKDGGATEKPVEA
ncbi:lipoyl(octanoyl) transferase LipB [Acidicapsa ligni]|uniref:lipoyl(octanoyl) transferase LipB n=1 Tax=Acidicapsa ligni TaxID=542300 RepID=UPI0021DFF775|nr:lipoyl(octanoyl) transferase LipB [Acidicapsa ligni]